MRSAGSHAPAVSVLMPAWNAAGTLGACLASLRRKTWRDWECLVVVDGSIDATPAIVMAAAREEDRFRLVSRPHAGLIPALNAGLAHGLGPLVARMDADDVMPRDRLEAQVRALEADTTLDAVAVGATEARPGHARHIGAGLACRSRRSGRDRQIIPARKQALLGRRGPSPLHLEAACAYTVGAERDQRAGRDDPGPVPEASRPSRAVPGRAWQAAAFGL